MRKISLILMVIHAAELFPGGSTCFCFDSFKTRLGKNSGADHTEKSCLSSGIDGMNYTSFLSSICITESLKIAWWCWEVWQDPWDAVLGQSTYCQEVNIQLAASALGKHPGEPCSPTSLFPSPSKAKFQDLMMVLNRNQGLGLKSWQYSLVQRWKKDFQTSVLCKKTVECVTVVTMYNHWATHPASFVQFSGKKDTQPRLCMHTKACSLPLSL